MLMCGIGYFIGFFVGLASRKKKKKGIRCTCHNPQWRDIPCNAKKRFAKDFNDGKI